MEFGFLTVQVSASARTLIFSTSMYVIHVLIAVTAARLVQRIVKPALLTITSLLLPLRQGRVITLALQIALFAHRQTGVLLVCLLGPLIAVGCASVHQPPF